MLGTLVGPQLIFARETAQTSGALPGDCRTAAGRGGCMNKFMAAQPFARLKELSTDGTGQRWLGKVDLNINTQ
jgi:hypothetical protein